MNRIKELRQAKNMKQSELSEVLSVAQNTLSYWENGKNEPDQKSLFALSDFFEVSIDYILCRTDDPFASSVQNTDDTVKFALFGDVEIDDDVMDEVKTYARFVAERKKKQKGK